MTCPACNSPNPGTQRFCGQCGAPLATSCADAETSPGPAVPPPPTPAREGGRFLPGAMLAGRYRMVALLGRGGMGEVYRAEDVKLGQPVALKFLPPGVERDADRLERFLGEVRLSLRVTHPNVCRVFDIGQIDDRQFLSMEYVDGEDLASLLRRIGRLPEDKAIEIARQMCAGLAAAHEEGVLHRDLKPANVMIDGRGRAKITDFGLAAATSGVSGAEARIGTPQYMAPEQLAGEELTERTDIYALGLVLYELFTGKRAFDVNTLDELARRQSSAPSNPSTHVTGLNPAVERAILRCLDPDPARRPASASAVAASLPGGDPLAMALAAGETPSPEMVARAGGKGMLPLGVGIACLVTVLAGLAGIWFVYARLSLVNRIPLPKPPGELIVDARAAMTAAGYAPRRGGSAYGFLRDVEYFTRTSREDQSRTRWRGLASVQPSPLRFWYREAPETLVPAKEVGVVTFNDPPVVRPGMTRVIVGPDGRLIDWLTVPPDVEAGATAGGEPEWSKLFAAARLDMATFTPADITWAAPVATDVRRSWSNGTLHVEGGALRGRAVWFATIPPWREPRTGVPATRSATQRATDYAQQAVPLIVFIGGGLMARRNIRLGRSDRRGAMRLALVLAGLGIAASILRMPADPAVWKDILTRQAALEVFDAALVWIFYVAVEPYVRRLWPNTLIAWNRLLEGRFRDPLVGRHILIGALAGVAFSAIFLISSVELFGPPTAPGGATLSSLASIRHQVAAHLRMVQNSFWIPVAYLLGVLLARVILRKTWLAYVVVVLIIVVLNAGQTIPGLVLGVMIAILALVLLTRLGLFAFLVAIVFSYWESIPLTTDPSSWFFPSSVVTMVLFAALATYGFVIAVGDQLTFKDPLSPGA